VRGFRAGDQGAARALILAGLAEHWGTLDPTLNPDLDDIAVAYGAGVFLVAVVEADGAERIVGTGALQPVDATTGQIVRMSVARKARRQGIGRQILDALLDAARARGMRRVVLETTATWTGAIAFYRRAGFEITHYQDGDVYFTLAL
jgi:ribosomal protein S18 acetylase RimI-like enzyme